MLFDFSGFRGNFKKVFFPFLEKQIDPKKTISIDTYKVEIFLEVYKQIKKNWPNSPIIFNDVSGKIDNEVLSALSDKKLAFTYVLGHNLAPTRDETSSHMDYTSPLTSFRFLDHLLDFFYDGITQLEKLRKIVVDPCFGFSKTREQNQFLIKNFDKFLSQIPSHVSCIYGVSNKSFLRFPAEQDAKNEQNKNVMEQMQSILIHQILQSTSNREVLFRVHRPESIQAAQNIKYIFDNS